MGPGNLSPSEIIQQEPSSLHAKSEKEDGTNTCPKALCSYLESLAGVGGKEMGCLSSRTSEFQSLMED